jgi:hypothetical protein
MSIGDAHQTVQSRFPVLNKVGDRDVEEREMVRETEIDALVRYASPNDIEIANLFFCTWWKRKSLKKRRWQH